MEKNLWQSWLVVTLLTLCTADHVVPRENGELYAAAEQLANWATIRKEVKNGLEKIIMTQIERLNHLDSVYRDFLLEFHDDSLDNSLESTKVLPSHSAFNPVIIFVQLGRLMKVIDELNDFIKDDNQEVKSLLDNDSPTDSEEGTLWNRIPSRKDYEACGEALIRLQLLYHLNVSQIVHGLTLNQHTSDNHKNMSRLMHYEDCLELGKIAYKSKSFSVATSWFQEALKLYIIDEKSNDLVELDILEYLAISAYQSGQLRYALNVTKLLIEKDPTNERANHNLVYFQEELKLYHDNIHLYKEEEEVDVDLNNQDGVDTSNYQIEKDKLTSLLCRRSEAFVSNNLACHSYNIPRNQDFSLLFMKVETLSVSPMVMRIHEFLTKQEASILRQLSLPILKRSTITSTYGLIHSEYRIAKTAWFSAEQHAIVKKIQNRISDILRLSVEDAEPLQVVNYGIGGFYGPHLDSGRMTEEETSNQANDNFEKKNERLVTVLMYLNKVYAGGATVFPRLNLSVLPIERSAVIWYNQKESGYSDSRTLHLACPVLLGTKWIATEWIRERSNIFMRRKNILSHEVGAS